jgi:hypothetical protein
MVRKMRDMKIQEIIFELLTQQYEQAKIRELEDTPSAREQVQRADAEIKAVENRITREQHSHQCEPERVQIKRDIHAL